MVAHFALRVLRAGLMGGLTPRTQPWFRLTVADQKIANSAAVKAWLDHAAERMLMVFNQSNLYQTLHLLYGEVGGFGTACALMRPDFDEVMRFYPQTIGTYWLANDHRDGDRHLHPALRPAGALGDPRVRRGSRQPRREGAQGQGRRRRQRHAGPLHRAERRVRARRVRHEGKRWRSVTWEEGKDDRLLRVAGYDRWPVLTPRWEVLADDPYGTGCGHAADPT